MITATSRRGGGRSLPQDALDELLVLLAVEHVHPKLSELLCGCDEMRWRCKEREKFREYYYGILEVRTRNNCLPSVGEMIPLSLLNFFSDTFSFEINPSARVVSVKTSDSSEFSSRRMGCSWNRKKLIGLNYSNL